MVMDLVVAARRVVTGGAVRPARVGVAGGRIAAIAPWAADLPADRTVVLDDDAVLLPGLVDTHVHVNEPGRTEWEGFATATAAAAAGGITTILDMPLNSLPPTVDPAALAVKRAAAAGRVHVDVGFWGGAVPGNLGGLTALHDAGVYGVKCFLLDSGVPEFPPLDPDQLRTALTELSTVDGLLIAHCEDPATVRPSPSSRDYADFLASRPPEAETRAVAGLIAAARETGARVHVVHVSAAEVLPLLRDAVADGVRITAETCPHYLALAADQVPAGATQFKCCPPMRDGDQPGRALGRAGRRHAVLRGVRPLALPGRAQAARHRRLRRRLGWDLLAPAVAAGGLDGGRRPRTVAGGRRAVDGGAAGRAGRAAVEGLDRARVRRGPGRVRPGRGVRGRRGCVAAPQPDQPVCGTYAAGRGAQDVVAGCAGRGPAGGAAAVSDFRALPDLAGRALGGAVMASNDEFFAEADNLLLPHEPVRHDEFGHKGKVYDGWETRRRRSAGQDWVIVRLGVPGIVRGVVVDTSFFTGNYPTAASLDGIGVEGHPTAAELSTMDWEPLLPVSGLDGDARNAFGVESSRRVTHVRLTIHPDGGVARLRVHGTPVADPRPLDAGPVDLAALENGAAVTGCSNEFYAKPAQLISPGLARSMGEGWETARRRERRQRLGRGAAGRGRRDHAWPSWTPATSSATRRSRPG